MARRRSRPAPTARASCRPRSGFAPTAATSSRPRRCRSRRTATTLEILSSGKRQWIPVDGVTYHRHEKPGGTPSLRVEYRCGLLVHREWVCLEHGGYARQKACEWWYRRAPGVDVPDTIAEALRLSDHLGVPSEIAIRPSGRFTEIVGARFSMHDQRLCAVCRREPRGFGWLDPVYRVSDPRRDRSYRQLCSRHCQDICHRRRGMIDPTPNEIAAMQAGGQAAGEYLESIGKSDLAALSTEEWSTLIEAFVTGYCETLRDLACRDRDRLDDMTAGVPY